MENNFIVDELTVPSVLLSNMIVENPNLIIKGKIRSEVEHYLFLLACSGKLGQIFTDYGQYLIRGLIYLAKYSEDRSYRDIGFPIRKYNILMTQLVDCLIDQSEELKSYEVNRAMVRHLFDEEIGIDEYGPSLDYIYFLGDMLTDLKDFRFSSRKQIILALIVFVKILNDNGVRYWRFSLCKRFKLNELTYSLIVSKLFLIVASDFESKL